MNIQLLVKLPDDHQKNQLSNRRKNPGYDKFTRGRSILCLTVSVMNASMCIEWKSFLIEQDGLVFFPHLSSK